MSKKRLTAKRVSQAVVTSEEQRAPEPLVVVLVQPAADLPKLPESRRVEAVHVKPRLAFELIRPPCVHNVRPPVVEKLGVQLHLEKHRERVENTTWSVRRHF